MQMWKNMALMAIGAGAVLAYQKYNKPMMKAMKRKWFSLGQWTVRLIMMDLIALTLLQCRFGISL